jgi:hypothetical protein
MHQSLWILTAWIVGGLCLGGGGPTLVYVGEGHRRLRTYGYANSQPLFGFLSPLSDIPQVYTLWKYPDILPILSIPGKAVPAMLHAPFLLGSDISQ